MKYSGACGKEFRLPIKQTQEMQVRSLGQKDPLEKEMATYSSILAGIILAMDRIPG